MLPDPRIRQELSAISNWPTIPQLFVDGELVGGCDIVTEMYESGELEEACVGVACGSVSRRMAPVAIATDSTHYLPRALADEQGIHQVSLYVGWQGEPVRELEMDGFDAFYERLRTDPRTADHLPALDRRLPGGVGAAARGRAATSSRSTSPAASRGPCEAARQAHGAARRARPRRARRGDRRRNRLRRAGPAGARRRAPRRAAGADKDAVVARVREARKVAADLVLPGHARVPAPRRADRQGPGLARRHAARSSRSSRSSTKSCPSSACAPPGARSSGWSRYAEELRDAGTDGWVVQHIQAPEQAERLIERCREIFDSEPLFISEVGPGDRHLHRARG